MARAARAQAGPAPFCVLLALVAALSACRAREGERCVCAEDCGEGLSCVASGRVLANGECSPAVGEDANPGVCLPDEDAAEDDGGGGPPVIFMDMGSKLDFEPGPPPDPETESAGTDATAGTTEASTGTTDATAGTTDATAGTTDATSSTGGSMGGTTDAASSSGGSTDASSGSTSVGT